MRDKASELEEINRKIFEVMVDDKDVNEGTLAQETEAADEYRVRYQQAKIAVNNIIESDRSTHSGQDIGYIMLNTSTRDNVRTFKLPKIELPKFNGELKDWLQFWSLFKNIHEDPSITKEDKLHYLV